MSRQLPPAYGLVIADMQNAFCHPDGAVYLPQALSQLALTADLVGGTRALRIPVIYTAAICQSPADIPDALLRHYPDLLSTWNAPGGLSEACWGARIADPIAPRPAEHVLRKKGLACASLAELATRLGLSAAFLAGTTTSSGVYAAALNLVKANLEVLAIEDCISGINETLRSSWLDTIGRYLGSVITFDDYRKTVSRLRASAGARDPAAPGPTPMRSSPFSRTYAPSA